MELLWLIGRTVFGVYFVFSGVMNLLNFQSMSQFAAYKKIPAPTLGVLGSGVFLIAGGLGILTGYFVQIAVILIAIFLVVSAFTMHNFWTIEDENAKLGDMNQFLKNIALAAACLMLLTITDWTWTL